MATIKKLVNFAAKFFEMGKDKKKAKAKPGAKSKSKPVAKKAAKPVAKKTSKPVKKAAPKAKAKPVKKAKAKPAPAKKVAKPVAKKAVKPVIKKKAAKPAKPVLKKNAPKAKPILKNTVKTEKPVKVAEVRKAPVKPVEKPVVKAAPRPVVKKEVKQMEENHYDPHMRYSDEDLKEFKDLIEKKLISAREELKNLKEALDNHTESQAGNKAWNMEEGTDTSEMEYLMNQISRQHQYIRNLELALTRVENKTYGICRVTGKLIPKERLRVVPHATLSLEAKVSRKSEEVSPGAGAVAPPVDFSEGFED